MTPHAVAAFGSATASPALYSALLSPTPALWQQVHIDDGRAQNGWRNTLAFDPLLPVKGFTYFDALLAPIVEALILALDNSSGPAWLSLQGEMGATGGLSSRLAQALACCCWCS